VGRTNLHELALGVTGINPWFGTPLNPLDSSLAPGGSSSGSAVAVATGEAAVAYGTDTGGSIRFPAACCGVCGLKTTWGRIPVTGVRPLAPSLDTVGPMAADVAGLVLGLQHFDLLVSPTLLILPPKLDSADELLEARCTLPVNFAGVPALALPVPTRGALPASIQLVSAAGTEERLLAAGGAIEAALTR
jgi:amidase